jgi:soluble lytic murein transglycosylase-like protein
MLRSIFTILGSFMMFSVITGLTEPTKVSLKETCEIDVIDKKSPPCLEMDFYIKKHAEKYNVPKSYAYGIAWKETGYEGPSHWSYEPGKRSSCGALGPMQIMPGTAKMVWNTKTIDKNKLRNDIEFNIETSMKLISNLYVKYKDWKIAFGAYNTGSPIVNKYARDVYAYEL